MTISHQNRTNVSRGRKSRTLLKQVRHVSLTVDTEEVEPVIHIQTHRHNVVPATGTVTPCIILLLLALPHHLHLLSPRLRAIVVKCMRHPHSILHLLLCLSVSIALLVHGYILRLTQCWIHKVVVRKREVDLAVCREQLIGLEILPHFLADVGRVTCHQE